MIITCPACDFPMRFKFDVRAGKRYECNYCGNEAVDVDPIWEKVQYRRGAEEIVPKGNDRV